jgi:tetratricopeptide (TPR) repeat protein
MHCSPNPSGKPLIKLPRKSVSKVSFLGAPDQWEAALELYRKKRFKEAGSAFGKMAGEYASIAAYPDSYGALARFYHLECLRLNGDYAVVGREVDRIKAQNVSLSPRYARQLRLFNAWGHVGKKLWEPLLLIVQQYEAEPTGGGGVAPTDNPFKKIPAREIVQLSYMRAIANENLGKKDLALNDYYRAFTLNYGVEERLSDDAMLGALRLLKAHPELAETYRLQKEAHGLATLYKATKGKLPGEYSDFLTEPPKPEE